MVRQVSQTIAKYGMFQAGDRVGIAVSGGPDSVALLRVLHELRSELGILLAVIHLNHRLRGAESDADQEFTRTLAGSLDLDFILESADVRAAGGNLEQAGRHLRLEFFRRLLADNRFQKIALGHTRTDQAETVLFRFLRGATTAGLAGIYPVLEGRMVRPLIEVGRSEVLEYLRVSGQPWREDSTNRSLDLARNRLRHSLLPLLEREWNPGLTRTLAHLADWARDEEEYWRARIREIESRYLQVQGRIVDLDAAALATLEPALARRLLRRAIEKVRGDLHEIAFSHIEQIWRLATLEEGHGRVQAPGVDALRSFNQLRLAPPGTQGGVETRNFSLVLSIPGTYEIPYTETRVVLELKQVGRENQEYNGRWASLDWERVPRPLWLRNWRPGDLYRPMGWGGPEKLKKLFQQRKVPIWERRHWPVVASGSEVIWSRGFGGAADLKPGPDTRTVLEIREE